MKFEKELRALLKKSLANQFTGNSGYWPDFTNEDFENPDLLKLLKTKYQTNKNRIRALFQTNEDKGIDNYLHQFDIKGLSETYNLLSDNYSKKLMVRIIAFRMLGSTKIKMPLTNKKHWDLYYKLKGLKQDKTISSKLYTFHLFNLREMGYDIKIYYDELSVFINYGLKQYEYSRNGHLCKANPGDYVIDGGSCFGDTALFFSNETKPKGHVFAFEFIPDNLKVQQTNFNLNSKLKKNITVVKNPLWSRSQKELFVIESGPGSKVTMRKPVKYDYKVETISIDDYVKAHKVKKVDFIKLDIEGAELECLKGAKETLVKFRPKIAVCIYHDIDHFVSIPEYIHKLLPDYDLFIDHYTIHLWESVLYGIPKTS